MNRSRFPRLRSWAMALTLPVAAAGCASLGGTFVPSPEEVPGLEARVAAAPTDAEALTRLGAAYQRDGRLDDASALLERARDADPENATTAVTLGSVYQDQNRVDDAIGEFQRFLELGPSDRSRARVQGWIRLLRRQQLRAAVRQSLAMEASLAQRPSPGTVAVFPFQFAGDDERLQPLGRAMAEMLATDLSQTDRLDVLERVQIQALLDEVALGQSGAVDPASAARGGRLLGAGRVVQGQVSGNEARLRLDAAVVEVGAQGQPGILTQEDAGARLFAMEKELAFRIYEEMGIPLSAAERERVNRRFTENLQALLAFGRGLQASDQGNYQQAQQHFREAAALDPSFQQAEALAGETADLAQAESASGTDAVEEVVTATVDVQLDQQVQAVSTAAAGAATRDPAQEALGTEGVAKGTPPTPITIIFRRPGGGQ